MKLWVCCFGVYFGSCVLAADIFTGIPRHCLGCLDAAVYSEVEEFLCCCEVKTVSCEVKTVICLITKARRICLTSVSGPECSATFVLSQGCWAWKPQRSLSLIPRDSMYSSDSDKTGDDSVVPVSVGSKAVEDEQDQCFYWVPKGSAPGVTGEHSEAAGPIARGACWVCPWLTLIKTLGLAPAPMPWRKGEAHAY